MRFTKIQQDGRVNEKQGELQDQIDACGAWDLETKLNIAMDALRCPEGDTPDKCFIWR